MAVTDHYATLGVARDADPEVVRAAYRALAKKYHPDTSPDKSSESSRRFRQISEAHSVLSDFSSEAAPRALHRPRSPSKLSTVSLSSISRPRAFKTTFPDLFERIRIESTEPVSPSVPLIAVLFNPFIPIHLNRVVWFYLDLGAAAAFLAHLVLVRQKLT